MERTNENQKSTPLLPAQTSGETPASQTPALTGNESESAGGKIVVLEIGRPIVEDVIAQFKQQPFRVISYKRPILEAEYPVILREAYNAIREASRGGSEVILILSGTLALAFQLGQLVGLSHFKLRVYQFSGGRYREVPPVTREVMF